MHSVKQINEMSRTEICKIDKSTLVDINDVKIDTTLPIAQRMQCYIEQVKNPYCFKCGTTAVKVEFTGGGKPLNQSLTEYFANLKNR